MTARRLVLIEWLDSHSSADGGWRPLGELEEHAEPVYCRSVGWLVSQANETTVIAAHLSGERNEGIRVYAKGDMAIPNGAILEMTTLRPPKRRARRTK